MKIIPSSISYLITMSHTFTDHALGEKCFTSVISFHFNISLMRLGMVGGEGRHGAGWGRRAERLREPGAGIPAPSPASRPSIREPEEVAARVWDG